MAYTGYINPEVAKMYGIPYSKLTARQKKILHEDSLRRAKLIKERQEATLRNGLKAFEDEAKMEKVLASIYRDCQKQILADVTETLAKVKKAGGTWSYANQSALTRSRGLFEQITKELTKLGQKEVGVFYQGLGNIYTDQYLRQMFTLGQFTEVKANLNRLNSALVKKTLDYPWSGAMFSDRLWNDKEKLGRNLRVGLTQSMILGEGIPEITERVRKNIDTSRYNAERVARTETKRVTYCAHNDVYEDTGVEELEYRCANGGDSRTCDLCRADNGKHYKRGEEPTLPRHPNCRCIYIPVVSDEFAPNELNELTGSIRGAENYDKWMQENADKLNPDGTLKEGWVRDWENGGKLVYKGDKPLPEAQAQSNQGKSDKVIQLENERRDVQLQIDAKTAELNAVSSKYQPQIAEITAKRDETKVRADAKGVEMQSISDERSSLIQKRRDLRAEHGAGKYSDDEYYSLLESISADKERVEKAWGEANSEFNALWLKINEYDLELRDIADKIRREQATIKDELYRLNTKLSSIDKRLLAQVKYAGHTDTFMDVMETIEANNVTAKVVMNLPDVLSEDEIIDRLAGGDMTTGSCSSLAFSYIGNKNGLDVIDFRGGSSQKVFSSNAVIKKISQLDGVKTQIISVKKEVADTAKILAGLEMDKEFYLAVGKHAAIVRRTAKGLEYLELQSGYRGLPNGWTSFDRYGTIQETLYRRFGCRKTVRKLLGSVWESDVVLMDVSSFKGNSEFREILSYINTDQDKQKKGAAGSVK